MGKANVRKGSREVVGMVSARTKGKLYMGKSKAIGL